MDKFSKKHQTPSSEFFRIFINVWEYVRLLIEKGMKPSQKYFQAKFLGKMQSEIKRFKNGILSLREKNSSGGLSYQRDALNKECNQKKAQNTMFKPLEMEEQNEVKGKNIEKRIGQFSRNVELLENPGLLLIFDKYQEQSQL